MTEEQINQEEIMQNLKTVLSQMQLAVTKQIRQPYTNPILIAVSKTKPPEMVIEAYKLGQRHFGENYVNELVMKSNNPQILAECHDIKWHFIGHLQTNKVTKLMDTKNLYMVQTVDSEKCAVGLNKHYLNRYPNADRLKIMVQVNTSEETNKNGVPISEVSSLVKFILDKCEGLLFVGLMTIGQYGFDASNGVVNPDFKKLVDARTIICNDHMLDLDKVELSMGMSSDFEHAIEMGSTYVRVGSKIFGERERKE